MNKTAVFRRIILCAGIVLLVISAVYFTVYLTGNNDVKVDNAKTLEFIKNILPQTVPGIKEERSNNNMPAITHNGQDYVALLSVPRFSVNFPVRSSWDRKAVIKVPCVFTGNPYEGTLIIGGVDSDGQFDFIPKIDIGDTVVVTDMKGYEFIYTVSTVKHAKNSQASTLIDEKSDLTLFAKEKRTGDWLLVRCKMN